MSSPHPTTRRRLLFASLGAATVLLFAPPVSAKEVASGGTPVPTTCSPVSSLKTDPDPRVGETGLATIDVDYSVKPCDSKQVVTVESMLTEYANPSVVLWDDPAAPTSGRFTVAGVKLRTTYAVTVIVRDATTGATVGSATQLTAAVPKGV